MKKWKCSRNTRVYPKLSGLSRQRNNNNKHSLRSNTKHKTHYTDSQNSDTSAYSGRELYDLQFSLQEASQDTFGYTLVSDMFLTSLTEVLFFTNSFPTIILWNKLICIVYYLCQQRQTASSRGLLSMTPCSVVVG